MNDLAVVMVSKIEDLWTRGSVCKLPFVLESQDDKDASKFGVTVHSLANELGVHVNTVARRLTEMEKRGKAYSYAPAAYHSPTLWWPVGGLMKLKERSSMLVD